MGEVIPELRGRFSGISYRVPVACGSIVDLALELERPATASEVNAEFRRAASEEMRGIVEYTEEPLVSTDIVGNPHSAIFDASFTEVVADRSLRVVAWYDNEWGYASRVVDLLARVGETLR